MRGFEPSIAEKRATICERRVTAKLLAIDRNARFFASAGKGSGPCQRNA